MAMWGRDTPWRQGHLLSDDAVKSVLRDPPKGTIMAVVSHDCDIAQSPDVEPVVEVIIGQRIAAVDGNFAFAKNARRLHLTLTGRSQQLAVDLEASRKLAIAKQQLGDYEPVENVGVTIRELTILQRWLAARYRRAAFPDEFDRRLGATGLRDQLNKILKSHGALISALYFDVDEGRDVCRSGGDEPYTLAIYILFDGDSEAAERAANSTKTAIEEAFRDKCLSDDDRKWRDIELVACEAISDQAMTVQQAENHKRWSADHISLRTEPPQPMLRNE